MVHGQNWPPRTRLTLRLFDLPTAGSRADTADPITVVHLVTNKQGAFSYPIKGQQFFSGPSPPGPSG